MFHHDIAETLKTVCACGRGAGLRGVCVFLSSLFIYLFVFVCVCVCVCVFTLAPHQHRSPNVTVKNFILQTVSYERNILNTEMFTETFNRKPVPGLFSGCAKLFCWKEAKTTIV